MQIWLFLHVTVEITSFRLLFVYNLLHLTQITINFVSNPIPTGADPEN